MNQRPWLWLVAGPNGAGKSTYAREQLTGLEVVGADEPGGARFEAGRRAVQRRSELLGERRSFAIETTLSGRRHLELVRQAGSQGWNIGMIYIGLASADLAIQRVRERVAQGGHDVPAADVRRRYERSLRNLPLICAAVDRLTVLDNSSARAPMKRLLEASRGRLVFRQGRLPRWLSAALGATLPPRGQ